MAPNSIAGGLPSVSLSLNEQSLQLDVRLPMAEVRTIAKKAQERME